MITTLPIPKILIAAVVMTLFSLGAIGQTPRPENVRMKDGPPVDEQSPQRRPNLLQELGLSPDQIQAVQKINRDRKPVEEAARVRFQNAQRALNMAIYADNVDDTDVQSKLAEFQAAQAELSRLKFSNELAIRKILTSDQLLRFRELRRRMIQARENRDDLPFPGRPLRRMRRGNPPPMN